MTLLEKKIKAQNIIKLLQFSNTGVSVIAKLPINILIIQIYFLFVIHLRY